MKLNKILLGGLTTALFSSALLAGGHGTHWGYTGHAGPENWGDLDPNYTMCKLGSNQSPINITNKVSVMSKDLEMISFKYVTGASSVINNGHAIQVNVADGSDIEIDGIKFALKQFHFHAPSENQIDGENFPLEAHFVHASKDGQLAVVALMFIEGKKSNKIVQKIWDRMPSKAGESAKCGLPSKYINELLPKDKDYYRFSGSLTTPPCSEGVRWMVLKEYIEISPAQIQEFRKIIHDNNRPIQPLNARKVMK